MEATADVVKKQRKQSSKKAHIFSDTAKGTEAGWKARHTTLRREEGLEEADPHATRRSDLISIAEGIARKKFEADFPGEEFVMPEMYTDTSQSSTRRPWALGTLRSVTTSSDFYAHRMGRHLSPAELFACLGFKAPNMQGLSQTQMKDLLGECMSVPASTVALVSLLTNLPQHWAGSESSMR